MIAELVDILGEAEAVDREVARVDIAAPEGGHRRLTSVEVHARGLQGDLSRSQPAIAKIIQPPEWEASDRMAWPPRQPSIAAAYAASIAPPFDPRYSADWWKVSVSEEAAAARQRERERTAKYYEDMTMQQEQRLNREEKERFEQQRRWRT